MLTLLMLQFVFAVAERTNSDVYTQVEVISAPQFIAEGDRVTVTVRYTNISGADRVARVYATGFGTYETERVTLAAGESREFTYAWTATWVQSRVGHLTVQTGRSWAVGCDGAGAHWVADPLQ